jgi:hypothetical protein
MATNQDQPLTIRLRCIDLPGRAFADRSDVRLGIQKGKIVIDDEPAAAPEVVFTCQLRVERNSETGKPNFLGPYAQGKPAERFIYLCWGERIGGMWDGVGRIKVPLKDLDWATVEQAIVGNRALEAVIRMTDQKGAPLYASVGSDFIMWQV